MSAHQTRGSNPLQPAQRRAAGSTVEQLAAQWLIARGLVLIETNYSCRLGELDLIMRDHDTLVFVEVRYRSHSGFMSPVTSVDHRKQRKLLRAASVYLQHRGLTNRAPCRFDVLGIHRHPDDPELRFDWITNAISA